MTLTLQISEDDMDNEELALVIRRFRKLNKNGRRFNWKKQSSQKSQNKSAEDDEFNKDVICFECKNKGHIRPNCPLLKKNRGKVEKYRKALKAETWSDTKCEESDDDYANICLMAQSDSAPDSETDSDSYSEIEVTIKKNVKWYLDSGCPRHMVGDSSCFIKLMQVNGGKVSFGGNSKGRVVRYETVKIGSLTITNVSLVEGLNYNLLSISQLCDIGFKIYFQEETCSGTSKDSSHTFTGQRHENIYLLDIKPEKSQRLISIQKEANLWHRKLGYINMN